MTRKVPAPVLGLAGLAVVILLWHLVTAGGLVSKAFLSSPSATWDALVRGLASGDLTGQLMATVLRMLNGWLLASVVAIALGSLIGISATARAYLRPTLAFARSLPASAVIPVAISLVGLSPSMVLGVIVFGSVWPTLLATVQGFATVEPRLKDVAQVLHLSRAAFIWKIGLPNAVPDIVAGMRLSLTVALILAVIGEMLSGQEGLGTAILLAARAFRAPELYAGIALLGLIGLVSSHGLLLVERRIVKWRAHTLMARRGVFAAASFRQVLGELLTWFHHFRPRSSKAPPSLPPDGARSLSLTMRLALLSFGRLFRPGLRRTVIGSHHQLSVPMQRQGLQQQVEPLPILMRESRPDVEPVILLLRPLDHRVHPEHLRHGLSPPLGPLGGRPRRLTPVCTISSIVIPMAAASSANFSRRAGPPTSRISRTFSSMRSFRADKAG